MKRVAMRGLIRIAVVLAAACVTQQAAAQNIVNKPASGGRATNGFPQRGMMSNRAWAAMQQNPQLSQKFDLNRNGRLDAAEMMAAQRALSGGGGGGQTANNGQGLNNNYVAPVDPDADAAAAAAKKRPPAPKKPKQKSLVERFDKDGDGKLNAEEKAAAKQAIADRQKKAK